jgi:hypothetical protein
MGIIHTAKKHIMDELVKKKRLRLLETLKSRNMNITNLTTKDEIKVSSLIALTNSVCVVGFLWQFILLHMYRICRSYGIICLVNTDVQTVAYINPCLTIHLCIGRRQDCIQRETFYTINKTRVVRLHTAFLRHAALSV